MEGPAVPLIHKPISLENVTLPFVIPSEVPSRILRSPLLLASESLTWVRTHRGSRWNQRRGQSNQRQKQHDYRVGSGIARSHVEHQTLQQLCRCQRDPRSEKPPSNISRTPCPAISCRMSIRVAPNAMRTPISCVRCAATNEITP